MVKFFYKIESKTSKIRIRKVASLFWHIIKITMNLFMPIYYLFPMKKAKKTSNDFVDKEVYISLTTYPKRLKTIKTVLQSLFRQTVKPTGIILWLARCQFGDTEEVMNYLAKFVKRGLIIKFVDEDIKAHKKYFFAMKEYPNALIITFDDDIFAPEDMLERLLKTYIEFPGCVVTQRAHEMLYNEGHKLLPYSKWNMLAKGVRGPSQDLIATGGAGTLYPPGLLSEHMFDIDVIKSKCLFADDIWLKCMGKLNNVPVVLTGINNPEIIDLMNDKRKGLASQNVENDLNDTQLKDVSNHYGIRW